MRRIFLILLVLYALTFTACSNAVDFVVINESDKPVEVRYQVDKYPDNPILRAGHPGITNVSPSRATGNDWRMLSEGEYQVDREAGTITARVMPGETLRIKWFVDANMGDDGPFDFPIQEINITGAYGAIRYQGKQASKAFIQETKYLYTLTYR